MTRQRTRNTTAKTITLAFPSTSEFFFSVFLVPPHDAKTFQRYGVIGKVTICIKRCEAIAIAITCTSTLSEEARYGTKGDKFLRAVASIILTKIKQIMKSHAWEEAVAFGGEGEGIAVILNFVGFSLAFVFTVLDTTLFDFSIRSLVRSVSACQPHPSQTTFFRHQRWKVSSVSTVF